MLHAFGAVSFIVIQTLMTQFSLERQSNTRVHDEHAFYLSLLEIVYPGEDGKTALCIKVFTDDLQNAVSEFQQTRQLITQEELCAESIDNVLTYLTTHVQVRLDNVPVSLQLQDCHIEGDSHWLTFQIAEKSWQQITLTSDFFMELFPTQTHVVSVVSGEKKLFARLTKDKKTCRFEF